MRLPPVALQEIARSTAEGRLELGGIAFADPWFLLIGPAAIALLWRGREARRHAPARVPTLGPAELAGAAELGTRLAWVPAALRIAAAVLVTIALSRPLEGRVSVAEETEGIDIALLLDRSSSMDQRPSPNAPRRFDVVVDVLTDFAQRRMTDEVSARDNIALFGFARFADLLVPFTLDVSALEDVLKETNVEKEQQLDGTAIGSALAKAVDVFSASEAKSRVVVLLTDGEETIHIIEPLDAAKAAAEIGIRVYTVYAGPKIQTLRTPFGSVRKVKADVGDLPEIAEMTGAKFFHAENRTQLEAAYAEIEELERTPRKEERFAERYDLYPYFVAPALLLFLLATLCGATFARRLP